MHEPALTAGEVARTARTSGSGDARGGGPYPLWTGAHGLIERLRQRAATQVDLERLARAAEAYVASRGEISFDRCIGLRGSQASRRIAERDAWIAHVAELVAANTTRASAAIVARRWALFVSAGPWAHWRGQAEPPDGASELNAALFHASSLNAGRALSEKQISRVLEKRAHESPPAAAAGTCG